MGILVAIEGIDGSGKGTQASRLRDTLRQQGLRVELLSFPRYRETEFGRKIGDFLNGRFGSLDQANPFLVALLFAGDRLESRSHLRRVLAENDIVICDRFVASNVAHQGAKRDGDERQELVDWILTVEHGIHELPRPDLTIYLDVPVAWATRLIALKAQRTYTDKAADLQEADANYLQRVADVYQHLAATEPDWVRVTSLRGDELKSVEEIASDVLSVVRQTVLSNRNPATLSSPATSTGSIAIPTPVIGSSFDDLATSRKAWLNDQLKSWCQRASVTALKQAELEWVDLAGKVAPEKTLWPWAWSRFPDLVHETLGIDETSAVEVALQDGRQVRGFPDARLSQRGQLVLWEDRPNQQPPEQHGPYSLDMVVRVKKVVC